MTKLLRVPLEIRHLHHFHMEGHLKLRFQTLQIEWGEGGDHSKVMS